MTSNSGTQWYVVQTHVNAESKAAANLVRQGFIVYLPRYQKRRSHARKVSVVARPLFPRYLFVDIDLGLQRWRPIQSTSGVSRLVCWNDIPAAVANGVVDSLKQREDEDGFIKLLPRPLFAKGDKVRIVEGAFADSLALVEGVDDWTRVTLLLELLGRKVRVRIESDLIAAA